MHACILLIFFILLGSEIYLHWTFSMMVISVLADVIVWQGIWLELFKLSPIEAFS